MKYVGKRALLLLMVLILVLSLFAGCTKPKAGTVYKATKGEGTVKLLSNSTFSAQMVELERDGLCITITGKGNFTYSGNVIRFYFTISSPRISKDDYLTAVVNPDGSFTACGRTYKKK